MQIFAINPPFIPRFSREQRSPAVTKSGTFYYPMWLAYAVGSLHNAGFNVRLIDAPANDKWSAERILSQVKSDKPELILLDTSTPSLYNDAEFATQLKEYSSNTYIAAVGPHVSALAEQVLSDFPVFDAVLVGEYELTAVELASAIEQKSDKDVIDGLVYRDGDAIHKNSPRLLIADLDTIPFVSKVYKDHLDIGDYFYSHSRYPIVTTLTARGCPYYCVYCVYPQTFSGREYRARSIENVIKEIKYIKRTWQDVREIMFEDDTFSIDHNRTRELCQAIIDENLNIVWTANARADLDYETLRIMKEAGCRLLCVGIESGSDKMLSNMGKKLTGDMTVEFFKAAKKAKVMIHGCFMVGNPGEDKQSMLQTLAFARKLLPDTAQFFPIMAYPGTAFYNWAEKLGYITTDDFRMWLTEQGQHNCIISTDQLDANELVEFCDYARKKFYFSPRYLLYKIMQLFRHPEEMGRTIKSAKVFFRYLFFGTK